jgi:hypothetical protein
MVALSRPAFARAAYGALALALSTLGGSATAQLRAVPLSEATVVYQIERFSVLSPTGRDWLELKRDKQVAYFGKKIASPTHSFIATAITARLAEKFTTPQDFRDFVYKMLPGRGDDRNAVMENRAELDDTLGRFCVRYYTKSADRNAIHAQGRTLFAETFGVNCLHPENPALSIDVSYSERGHPGEFSSAFRGEGESFVRSLKFL